LDRNRDWLLFQDPVRPLIGIALLIVGYWKAPAKLARAGWAIAAVLVSPYLIYVSVHGVSKWSPDQSPLITLLQALAFIGGFTWLVFTIICEILDIKRRP
jgi:hypothetical protein